MFFLVITRYVAPIEQIDGVLSEHIAYLEAQYRDGYFLLSGPKRPRDGGIILARAGSEDQLVAILEQDPFRRHGLIEYDVHGWGVNRRAPSLPPGEFEGAQSGG